jgi:hypothetical protein
LVRAILNSNCGNSAKNVSEAFFAAEKELPEASGGQVQQNISFSTALKEAIKSFHHKVEAGTSDSDITAILRKLRSDPWYPNLVVLVYLFSMALGVDLLLAIPTANGHGGISPTTSLGFIMIFYVLWLFLEFGILFVSTFIFLGDDLRDIWSEWFRGKEGMPKKDYSVIGWIVVILILVGISMVFYIFVCAPLFLPF